MAEIYEKSKFAQGFKAFLDDCDDPQKVRQEIARETGFSDHHLRQIANQASPKEPSIECAEAVANYISKTWGDHRCVTGPRTEKNEEHDTAMVSWGYDVQPSKGEANGSTKDDMQATVKNAVHADDYFERVDEADFFEQRRLLREMEEKVDAGMKGFLDMRAEIDAKRKELSICTS